MDETVRSGRVSEKADGWTEIGGWGLQIVLGF
jgi:hypothetical protein